MRGVLWLGKNPLFPLAISLASGLAFGPLALWACVTCSVLWFWKKKTLTPELPWWFPLLLSIGASAGLARVKMTEGRQENPAFSPGHTLVCEGRVGAVFTPPQETELRAWFELELAGEHAGSRLRVRLPENQLPPLPGSLVRIGGTFRPGDKPTNPWEWDEVEQLANRGIPGNLWVADDKPVEILSPPPWWHLMAWGERGRRVITTAFISLVPETDRRAVVLGIMLGAREGMSEEALLAFRRTGSLHLFAVSGMHVGMMAGIFWGLLLPLPLPRRKLAWFLLPLLLGYTVLTGAEPPAVRALVMIGILVFGLVLDRTPRILNSLSAAFIVMLLHEPNQRHDLGFQLTFCVVLAIVLIGLPLAKKFSAFGQPDPFLPADLVSPWQRRRWGWVRFGTASLCFGIAANLGSLPLSIHHFNLATPSGVFLGLALVPLSWLILCTATGILFFLPLGLGWFVHFCGWIAGGLAAACLGLCAWAASLPGAWHLPRHDPPTPVEMLVFDLDRGGASALIRNRQTAWLLDTGNPGHARRVVCNAALHLGTAPLDLVVHSHEDVQHRGGQKEIIRLLGNPIQTWTKPRANDTTAAASMELQTLFPPPGWAADRADDRSAIFKLSVEGWTVFWLGDAGFGSQKWMLEHTNPAALRSDVLCVGWHGTDIGLVRDFVDAVDPKLVVWHRWRPETLNPPGENLRAYLRERGIPLLEQRNTGALTFGFTEETLTVTPFLAPNTPTVLHRQP
ncbi:MAG: ComEC/Rec2 family competence protein [Verrucomicrobiales bacterium]